MKNFKYSKNALIKAIRGSNGLISTIAQRLKADRKTVRNYLKIYPELNELIEEEKENIVDFAESKLFKKLQEEDSWAIKFTLLNQGRKRGYGNTIEMPSPYKIEKIEIEFIDREDVEKMRKE